MRTRTPTQQSELPLDFGDDERFANDDDAIDAGLHAAACLHLSMQASLNYSSRISDRHIKKVLDFYGPFGAGEQCYHASQYLLTRTIPDDFNEIAWRVRRRCQELMAVGRVTEK
jgi:hypothetical protein